MVLVVESRDIKLQVVGLASMVRSSPQPVLAEEMPLLTIRKGKEWTHLALACGYQKY